MKYFILTTIAIVVVCAIAIFIAKFIEYGNGSDD